MYTYIPTIDVISFTNDRVIEACYVMSTTTRISDAGKSVLVIHGQN